jgi:hypothetical protein
MITPTPQATIAAWLQAQPSPRRRAATPSRRHRPAPAGTCCANPACAADCSGKRVTRGLCGGCYAYWALNRCQRPSHVIRHGAQQPRLQTLRRQPANNRFGALLYLGRHTADLSIGELAAASGCDPSYISRLECGTRMPPRRWLVEVFALLLNLDAAATERLLLAAGLAPSGLLEVAG